MQNDKKKMQNDKKKIQNDYKETQNYHQMNIYTHFQCVFSVPFTHLYPGAHCLITPKPPMSVPLDFFFYVAISLLAHGLSALWTPSRQHLLQTDPNKGL